MIELSIVLPTRNRSALLRNALVTICSQTICQSLYEVIVCDNNSSDDTEKVAKEFSCKFENFKYFKTLEPGLHVGRNKGFMEARGNILVFIDDDIEAFPDWLKTIYDIFRGDEKIYMVGGRNLPKWEKHPPDWIMKMWTPDHNSDYISAIYSIIDLGNEEKEINPYYVFGCNFSIRKEILVATNGFHPDGMPDELLKFRGDGESAISEFVRRNKLKAYYHPDASVFHIVSKERLSEKYVWKRGYNQGISDSYTNIRAKLTKSEVKPEYPASIIQYSKILISKIIKIYNIFKLEDEYLKIYKTGYREGYNFHRNQAKADPELLKWIMKANYL